MPSSTETFLGCLCLIISLKSFMVSVAYFILRGSTLRYRGRQSTATRRYFKPRLYLASLSKNARSTDQNSYRCFTFTLCLENLRPRERYLVKDGFVSKYICTFFVDNFLMFCSLFAFPNDAGPFKRMSISFTSSIESAVFSTRVLVCHRFALNDIWFCFFLLSQIFLLVVFGVFAAAVFLILNRLFFFFSAVKFIENFFCLSIVNQVGCYIKFTQNFGIWLHSNFFSRLL